MPREKHIIIGDDVTPEEVVAEALDSNCRTIAYTYTEPTIFFEYAEDTGVLAHEKGLKNIFVTNGYMTKECVGALDGIVDAANVDLKSFNDATYRRLCGARLEPVLETIERMRSVNMWIEVTTLVIPTVNDSDEELRSIARWLSELDVSIPWHISAFYPTYKMSDIARTPEEVIKRAREIGLAEGLRYVYTGNIPDLPGESTYCYECKRMLIERDGYVIKANHIEASKCPDCGALIDGVGL
jgi:pyruvate formate lyase activating enzyme